MQSLIVQCELLGILLACRSAVQHYYRVEEAVMTFADTQLDAEMAEWKRRISMFKDTEDFDEVTVQRLRLTLCGHQLAESILSQSAR